MAASDSDDSDQDSIQDGIEDIRRACITAGINPNFTTPSISDSDYEDSSEIDDVELARKMYQRLGNNQQQDEEEPVFLQPLKSLPPIGLSDDSDLDDGDENDFETIRAIERRFASYNMSSVPRKNVESVSKELEVHGFSTTLEQETFHNSSVNRKDTEAFVEDFQGFGEACNSPLSLIPFNDSGPPDQPFYSTEGHQAKASNSSTQSSKYPGFLHPESRHFFIDAIKKNRAFQKLIRSKMTQLEARIAENKELKKRIKNLEDYQLLCKKRAGRLQKKDGAIQLISARKSRKSRSLKVNDKKVSPLYFGPVENSHVAHYRKVLEEYPLSLRREPWSVEEKGNLGKGIEQQYQEMLFQQFLFSDPAISCDTIIASITNCYITPEDVRSFLPKVDWKKLASLYAVSRSGEECEARWLNHEEPLINHSPWDRLEEKNLLNTIQQRGSRHNWIDISTRMRTNRTPFQCLVRYQRSLNSDILKRDWAEEDVAQLCAAVEAFGENDWQLVASHVVEKTGTQCSEKWKKSVNPAIKRKGRWIVEEDKHLKVAVMLFGSNSWNKIAQFVPGRNQSQCRERWFDVLNPSLNLKRWTEEEDSRLKAAISEHGHCWSKVAEAVLPRTDNQCRRRWKVLFPHEVLVRQEARRIHKIAFISNFVDRKAERPALGPSDFLPLPETSAPALGPSDFLPLPETSALTEAENRNSVRREKGKTRRGTCTKKQKDTTLGVDAVVEKKNARTRGKKHSRCPESHFTTKKRRRVERPEKKKPRERELCDHPELPLSTEPPMVNKVDGCKEVTLADGHTPNKQKERKRRPKRKRHTEPLPSDQELLSSSNPLAVSGIPNDEEDTISLKELRARYLPKNRCTETEDLQNLSLSRDPSSHTTVGNNALSKRRRIRKPTSVRSLSAGSVQDHQSSSLSFFQSTNITSQDRSETLAENNTARKKRKVLDSHLKEGIHNSPAQEGQELLLTHSEDIQEAVGKNWDITLACIKKKSKKK